MTTHQEQATITETLGLAQSISRGQSRLIRRFENFEDQMNGRLGELEIDLLGVKEHLREHDARFDTIDTSFNVLEQKLDQLLARS